MLSNIILIKRPMRWSNPSDMNYWRRPKAANSFPIFVLKSIILDVAMDSTTVHLHNILILTIQAYMCKNSFQSASFRIMHNIDLTKEFKPWMLRFNQCWESDCETNQLITWRWRILNLQLWILQFSYLV